MKLELLSHVSTMKGTIVISIDITLQNLKHQICGLKR